MPPELHARSSTTPDSGKADSRQATVLHVVTNVDRYLNHPEHPTGLWLSELTHAWDVFEAAGFTQIIASPLGGKVPLEPRAMKFPLLDASAKRWLDKHGELLAHTASVVDISVHEIDAIFFTGGHAVMYDFDSSEPLADPTRQLSESGKIVSSVCHGYCGLLDVTLSDGSPLVAGRILTGFSWREEILAGVSTLVPYNAEQRAHERGAAYRKAPLPFLPYAVADGNLITGQNPTSARKTARLVRDALLSQ